MSAPPDAPPDAEVTLVPCLACGGDFRIVEDLPDGRHRMAICRWCHMGGQSPFQVQQWREQRPKATAPESPPRPLGASPPERKR